MICLVPLSENIYYLTGVLVGLTAELVSVFATGAGPGVSASAIEDLIRLAIESATTFARDCIDSRLSAGGPQEVRINNRARLKDNKFNFMIQQK